MDDRIEKSNENPSLKSTIDRLKKIISTNNQLNANETNNSPTEKMENSNVSTDQMFLEETHDYGDCYAPPQNVDSDQLSEVDRLEALCKENEQETSKIEQDKTNREKLKNNNVQNSNIELDKQLFEMGSYETLKKFDNNVATNETNIDNENVKNCSEKEKSYEENIQEATIELETEAPSVKKTDKIASDHNISKDPSALSNAKDENLKNDHILIKNKTMKENTNNADKDVLPENQQSCINLNNINAPISFGCFNEFSNLMQLTHANISPVNSGTSPFETYWKECTPSGLPIKKKTVMVDKSDQTEEEVNINVVSIDSYVQTESTLTMDVWTQTDDSKNYELLAQKNTGSTVTEENESQLVPHNFHGFSSFHNFNSLQIFQNLFNEIVRNASRNLIETQLESNIQNQKNAENVLSLNEPETNPKVTSFPKEKSLLKKNEKLSKRIKEKWMKKDNKGKEIDLVDSSDCKKEADKKANKGDRKTEAKKKDPIGNDQIQKLVKRKCSMSTKQMDKNDNVKTSIPEATKIIPPPQPRKMISFLEMAARIKNKTDNITPMFFNIDDTLLQEEEVPKTKKSSNENWRENISNKKGKNNNSEKIGTIQNKRNEKSIPDNKKNNAKEINLSRDNSNEKEAPKKKRTASQKSLPTKNIVLNDRITRSMKRKEEADKETISSKRTKGNRE